jgi:hypothetical protein
VKSTLRLTAVCLGILIGVAAAAGLADPSPRVETVDSAGARQVYVPKTQPSDATALPRIEILDIDGARSVFVPKPADPTTKPADLYARIGGIPADAKPVASGDLSSLRGNVLLTGDSYTASGGIVANLYDPTPGTPESPTLATVSIPTGKQVNVAVGVKLGGVRFVGGGLSDGNGKLKNTNGKLAAVIVNDRCKLESVEVTRAGGVGILFQGGDQQGGKFIPALIESYGLHPHHNGTSGRMVRARGDNVNRGSGFLEVDTHLHHDNIGGANSDAANKGTQTSDHLCVNLRVHDEEEGAAWYDISCWNCVLVNPDIQHITTDTPEKYRAVGVRFELNCYGTYASGIYGGYIGDMPGSAVAVDESSNIEIKGVRIGPCAQALEVRQLTRADDPGDGGLDPAKWLTDARKRAGPGRPGGGKLAWEVIDLRFTDNVLLPGAGPISLSGAGSDKKKDRPPFTKDLRLSKNRITVEHNTGNVVVKIAA